MSNKDFTCARIIGQATSLRVKGKRCGNNCLKGMNIGSGWERKSIMQRCPFIFIIRTENSRNNQTVGRKTTLRLRTSFRKPQAVTLSSLAWRNRQKPARIGHWGMVSDKVDFLAGNCIGAMPDHYELIMPGTRTLQFESHRAFQSLLGAWSRQLSTGQRGRSASRNFLRSVLRSSKILMQNCATLRNALRKRNDELTYVSIYMLSS